MPDTVPVQGPGKIRGLRVGFAGWLVFAIMLVALRGARWDENYEFAQVLIGEVKYPASHPLAYWVHHLFTGQLYFTAAMMELLPGPFAINAMRNVLFIWATVLPPFLLGAALGRNALAGHMAAVMMLSGVTLDFDASYPQFILPGMFSNGHVGSGFALLAVATLALGRPATAFFLMGLMPAVHVGQTPQMLLFIGFLFIARRLHPQPAGAWHRADLALFGGFATSVVILAAGYFIWRDPAIPAPLTASGGDAHTIWAGWVGYYDMHRRAPGILAILLTVAFVFFAYLVMLGLGYAKDRTKLAWPLIVVYICGTLLIVLSVMLAQTLLGPDIPKQVLTWLPYRLWNHLPPILVAAIVAKLLPPSDDSQNGSIASSVCLGTAVTFLVLQPTLQAIAPADVAARYLSSTSPVLFYLIGAAFTLIIVHLQKPIKHVATAVAMGLVFILALIHQFGFACVVAGSMTALIAQRVPRALRIMKYQAEVFGALLAVIVAQFAAFEFLHREQLPVGDFERAAAAYLRDRDERDAMITPPMGQVLLQAQTGHPVLEDLATPFFIGYQSSMGPLINAMYIDVYGVDFRFPSPARPWQQLWSERSAEEWRALGAKYEFRYVVAPQGIPLDLDSVVSVNGRTLYRIG